MKKLIVLGVVLSATVASSYAITKEEWAKKLAERNKRIMAKHGGFINRPGTPSGSIVVVNSQKKITNWDFEESAMRYTDGLRGLVRYIDGEAATVSTAAGLKAKAKADIAVFIVDDPSLPISLLAPEAQWAICNLAPLKQGTTDEQFALRAKAEFARVFGLICGGVASQFKSPIMNEVSKPTDLDGKVAELPVDVSGKFGPYLEARGVKPAQMTIYRKACQEGWAPQPTNEFQKTIWNEVHQLPTKPLTIKYDAKKGE